MHELDFEAAAGSLPRFIHEVPNQAGRSWHHNAHRCHTTYWHALPFARIEDVLIQLVVEIELRLPWVAPEVQPAPAPAPRP
jgi:hypothetical protein